MEARTDECSTGSEPALLLATAHEALRDMRVSDALALFDKAEQQSGNADMCAGGRWTCYMLLGQYENAWRESDAIALRAGPDPNRFWSGESLRGQRVLIRCLHGLGDTIQFIRYAPLLRNCARSVTIEAQPALRAIITASDLGDAVITWGDPEGEWDSQVEVVELPRIFRTSLLSIPNRVPYLRAQPVPTDSNSSPASRENPLRVGLVWRSSTFNPARSIEAELIATLFDIPGICFFNIQTGPELVELQDWQDSVPVLHHPGDDVLATAVKLESLDLIVTVDTMVAHLAGALAKPVWTLLPFQCDWRWMLRRPDSPWYPTMRLVRQPQPGDWPSVIEIIRRDLRRVVKKRSAALSNRALPPAPAR